MSQQYKIEPKELSTYDGAAANADMIRRYWLSLGFDVRPEVIKACTHHKASDFAIYGIRTSGPWVNGLPPDALGEKP